MEISTQAIERLDIQGHRGAAGLKAENTLPSFEVALDLGVDTIECDVLLTKDDQVVIWHDPYLKPAKCRRPEAHRSLPDPDVLPSGHEHLWIRHLTAEQLASYRCDRIPDADKFPDKNAEPTLLAGSEYRILRLEELFAFVERYAASDEKSKAQRQAAARCRFNIEIKRDPGRPEYVDDGFDGRSAGILERRIIELVRRHELQERVVIQSFDARSVRAVGELDDTLALAMLEKERTFDFDDLRRAGVNTWSPHVEAVDRSTIDQAHIAGLEVIPWTVNELPVMVELVNLGVDGLITDRPDLILGPRPSLDT